MKKVHKKVHKIKYMNRLNRNYTGAIKLKLPTTSVVLELTV